MTPISVWPMHTQRLFKAFLKHDKSVKVVTFWGVNDGVSWRANGRPSAVRRQRPTQAGLRRGHSRRRWRAPK